MKLKNITAMTGIAAAALAWTGAAQAASVSSLLFPGQNLLSDNSAEELINAGGATDTIVDVGDRLRGIFRIETIEDVMGPGANSLASGSGNNELAGLFDITVTGVTIAGGAIGGGTCTSVWCFTFGPTASFEATYGAGAMVAFYEDAVHEFSRTGAPGTQGVLEGNITDGSLLWVAGLTGPSTFWTAGAFTNDIAIVGAVPSPGNGGQFNIAADLLVNNSTRSFTAVPCGNPFTFTVGLASICGSGSLLGTGGVATPYDSFDDVNFTMNTVPEPGSVLLMGAGLLGLGASVARSRKKA